MELSSKTKTVQNGIDKTDHDFNEVIETSKARISETPVKEPKIKPKRGRGRPRIEEKRRPESIEGSQNASIDSGAISPPPDLSKFLKAPLMSISKVPAINVGIPELALTSEEADLCAQSLNECLQAFVPDMGTMSPKTAAVIGAVSVFGSIGFQKYSIYKSKMSEKKPTDETKKTEVQQVVQEVQKESGIPAEKYFETTRV